MSAVPVQEEAWPNALETGPNQRRDGRGPAFVVDFRFVDRWLWAYGMKTTKTTTTNNREKTRKEKRKDDIHCTRFAIILTAYERDLSDS